MTESDVHMLTSTTKKTISCATALALAASIALAPASAFAEDFSNGEDKPVIVSANIRDTDMIGTAPVSEYIADVAALTPIIDSPRACVMDLNGNILYGRALDEECKIASITKVMTAIVAAEYNPNLMLTVSRESANTPGSTAELWMGMQLTVQEALKGLMLPSGNDAAYAIAAGVGGSMWMESHNQQPATEKEYIALFVQKMNEKAQQIGMTHTLFANPCGLDDEGYEGNHHSTARDVALMTAYANSVPAIVDIVDDIEDTMHVKNPDGYDATIKMVNTNALLKTRTDVLGTKTGFTDLAGNCLAGTYRNDDDENAYVVVVLGNETQDGSFDDSAILMDWLNDSHRLFDMTANCDTDVKTGQRYIGRAGIPCWDNKRVGLILEKYMFSEQWYWNATPQYAVELNVPNGQVNEGDVVGTYKVLDEQGDEVDSCAILASETVDAPDFFETLGVWFNRFLAFFQGKGSVAEDMLGDLTPVPVDFDEVAKQARDLDAQDEYMRTDQYGISKDDKAEIYKLLNDNPDIKTNVNEDGTIQQSN